MSIIWAESLGLICPCPKVRAREISRISGKWRSCAAWSLLVYFMGTTDQKKPDASATPSDIERWGTLLAHAHADLKTAQQRIAQLEAENAVLKKHRVRPANRVLDASGGDR